MIIFSRFLFRRTTDDEADGIYVDHAALAQALGANFIDPASILGDRQTRARRAGKEGVELEKGEGLPGGRRASFHDRRLRPAIRLRESACAAQVEERALEIEIPGRGPRHLH